MTLRLCLLAAMAIAGFAASASAATITFGSRSEFFVDSYVEAGFEFSFLGRPTPTGTLAYHGSTADCAPSCADNRSPWLALLQDCADTIVMHRVDDAAFRFHGFDGAESYSQRPWQWASAIQVSGVREDRSTLVQTFTLDQLNDGRGGKPDFQHFVALNFFDTFVELTFTGLTGPLSTGREFAIDNVLVSAVHPVPEPASFVLLATGIAGVVARRRRARQRPA